MASLNLAQKGGVSSITRGSIYMQDNEQRNGIDQLLQNYAIMREEKKSKDQIKFLKRHIELRTMSTKPK